MYELKNLMLLFMLSSIQVQASTCRDLFNPREASLKTTTHETEASQKNKDWPTDFEITIIGKSNSEKILQQTHQNFLNKNQISEIFDLVAKIEKEGTQSLSPLEIKKITDFRQETSVLRSAFQTSSDKHKSPKKFGKFVRDFGHLKDMVLIRENMEARLMATTILKEYKGLNFSEILKDIAPSKKNSTYDFINSALNHAKTIMNKKEITVDEVHDVRKNLRDILRYLQNQQTLTEKQISLSAEESKNDTPQIKFLKKINKKLGEVCDNYAAQIIRKEITENTNVVFPEDLRPRVEHYLAHARVLSPNETK